jgi:dihydroorotate dehydrogenase electron transfer subunit
VADRAATGGWRAWLSLDKHMGCGVGACLACVQRIRAADGTQSWQRVCRDGPVFEARTIVWEDAATASVP